MIIKYGCICPLTLQTAGKKRGMLMKEFIICLCYAAGLGVLIWTIFCAPEWL